MTPEPDQPKTGSYAHLAAISFYIAGVVLALSREFLHTDTSAFWLVTQGLLLLGIALPLIGMNLRCDRKVSEVADRLNLKARNERTQHAQREENLKDALQDLERFIAIAMNRETRIIELKSEVNALLEQQGKSRRYHTESNAAEPSE